MKKRTLAVVAAAATALIAGSCTVYETETVWKIPAPEADITIGDDGWDAYPADSTGHGF